MPSQAIIVGGGIAAGSPFTVGALTRIIDDDPPTIADSIVRQRTQTTQVITVGLLTATDWPLQATITERLQVVGGFVSDSGAVAGVAVDNVLIGRTAATVTVANARNVVIGTGAVANAAGGGLAANTSENVVIGFNAIMNQGVGNCVIIGQNFTFGATGPVGSVVAIGSGITINNSFSGPVVGASCTPQGSGTAIGNQISTGAFNNWVAVGRSVDIQANRGTAVGDNVTISAGHSASVVLGSDAVSIAANSFVVGALNQNITTMLIGGGDVQDPATSLTWRQTNATGTDILGGILTIVASRGTGNAATQGSILFQTGTPGATGVALQAAASRLAIRPPTGVFVAAVDFMGTATAAGVAAGTLTNAPSAGDPSYWLAILIDGAVRKIPCWT